MAVVQSSDWIYRLLIVISFVSGMVYCGMIYIYYVIPLGLALLLVLFSFRSMDKGDHRSFYILRKQL